MRSVVGECEEAEAIHYCDVIMSAMASQTTSRTIVYTTDFLGAHPRKHQSSASLAFVWGIHRSPANSPHKWPVTRKMLPLDDVIMTYFTTFRCFLPRLCSSPSTFCCSASLGHMSLPLKLGMGLQVTTCSLTKTLPRQLSGKTK